MTKNQIAYWDLEEKKRNNVETLKETKRANRAKEGLTAQSNANTLTLGVGNLQELSRSNLAKEGENVRTNMENENIKRRTNAISAAKVGVDTYNAETNRMNAGTNALNAQTAISNLAEVMQHNRNTEQIAQGQLDETVRSNKERENQQRFVNAIEASSKGNKAAYDYGSLDETSTHNRNVEGETKRNNLVNQQIDTATLMETINRDKWNTLTNLIGNMKPNISYRYSGGTR